MSCECDVIKPGDRCTVPQHPHNLQARVMAVADGYAMLRYPRAMPFVVALTDLQKVVQR